jgi:hypothetical protein
MGNEAHPVQNAEAFWQRFTLPEEERRSRSPMWNGSYRWFRSPNIIDLWNYRSTPEKQRIIDFMWQRQLGAATRFRVLLYG